MFTSGHTPAGYCVLVTKRLLDIDGFCEYALYRLSEWLIKDPHRVNASSWIRRRVGPTLNTGLSGDRVAPVSQAESNDPLNKMR